MSALKIECIYVKYKNPERILQLLSNKDIHVIKEMLRGKMNYRLFATKPKCCYGSGSPEDETQFVQSRTSVFPAHGLAPSCVTGGESLLKFSSVAEATHS